MSAAVAGNGGDAGGAGDGRVFPSALLPLAGLKRWVGWRWVRKTGKDGAPLGRAEDKRGWDKPPLTVVGGTARLARTDQDDDLLTYSELVRLGGWSAAGLHGVGFAPRAGDGLLFADLDGCRDAGTGVVAGWAMEFVRRCGSYTEVSPSGTGLRVIGLAGCFAGRPTKTNFVLPGESGEGGRGGGRGELYRGSNYVTVTFNRLGGTPDRLADIGAAGNWILESCGLGPESAAGAGGLVRPGAGNIVPIKVVRETLARIPNREVSWHYWKERIGMSVWASTGGSEEGLEAWDAWSKGCDAYGVGATCEAEWERMRASPPERCSFGTLLWEARQAAPGEADGPEWLAWQAGLREARAVAMARTASAALDQTGADIRTETAVAGYYGTGDVREGEAGGLPVVAGLSSADPRPEGSGLDGGSPGVIDEFNRKYMVVNEAGKAVVYAPAYERVLRRSYFERISFGDLRNMYLNRLVQAGVDHKGKLVWKEAAEVWLRHRDRRQYIGGLVFDPGRAPGGDAGSGVLNLWQGFGVEARVGGSWDLLRQHILEVICCGDRAGYDYLLGWMARMVQQPVAQGEVAVVLRGAEGVGKGTLAKVLIRLLGQHGMAIANAKHLTGQFNAHLRDCVFLFADEAFFAGDRAHVGVLKSIITEPHLTVEGKYKNAITTPNYLHLMMASNEAWVVPASLEARRFAVFEVSGTRASDREYFKRIWQQMDAGGYEAMLGDLLAHDLTGFDVRNVPVTEGLQTQKVLSLGADYTWWLDVLHRGYVSRAGFESWTETVPTEALFASYQDHVKSTREYRTLNRVMFGRFMNKVGGVKHREPKGPRSWGYYFGSLDNSRALFEACTGLRIDWETDSGPTGANVIPFPKA